MDDRPYTLDDDPRVGHLADLLQSSAETLPLKPRVLAHGLVCSILRWSAHHAPGGDLAPFAPSVIANAIGWRGDADTLVAVMMECGFFSSNMQIVHYREMMETYDSFVGWLDANDE
jgi:hypothetical protein